MRGLKDEERALLEANTVTCGGGCANENGQPLYPVPRDLVDALVKRGLVERKGCTNGLVTHPAITALGRQALYLDWAAKAKTLEEIT